MAFTNDETETLQSLVRSCLLEINRLKTDLAASEKERFDLESEKVQIAHDETINELNAQLSKKDNDFAIYRNDVQDKIDDLKSELFEKTEELNVKNKIIMDNENLISNQDEKIRKLSDFDANIKSVRTAIEDDISSIKSSLEEVLNGFREGEELTDEEIKEKSDIINQKDSEIKSLSKNIEEYKIQVLNLQNQLDSKDNFIELKDELSITKHKLEEKEIELNNYKEDSIPKTTYDELVKKVNDLNNLIKSKDEIIVSLKESNSKVQNIQNELDHTKELLESKNHELETVNNNMVSSEEYMNLKSEVNSLNTILNSKETELQSLKENSISKNEYNSLQEKYDELKNDYVPKSSYEELGNELQLIRDGTVDKDKYEKILKDFENYKKLAIPHEKYENLQNELYHLKESSVSKEDYTNIEIELSNIKNLSSEKIKNLKDELDNIKSNSVSKEEYDRLKLELDSTKERVLNKDNEIASVKNNTINKDDFNKVQNELNQVKRVLSERNSTIEKLNKNTVNKSEYDKLVKENSLKDQKIDRLEKIKDLFTELEAKNNADSKDVEKLQNKVKDIESGNDEDLIKENEVLKEEIQSKDNDIERLKEIETLYHKLIIPPKNDLTSFQSQVFNLIPDEPSTAEEIHKYIKRVAFDKISLKSIENILKKLIRKGYMESHEDGDKLVYTKIAEDITTDES